MKKKTLPRKIIRVNFASNDVKAVELRQKLREYQISVFLALFTKKELAELLADGVFS